MLFRLKFPTNSELERLIERQQNQPLSYPIVSSGVSIQEKTPEGYRYDDNRILLGKGQAIFEAGRQAIQAWKMFPGGWACIYSDKTPIEVGRVVVMCAQVWGLWWLNVSRIVFTIDEPNRFGFAYGTLQHHAESGEELFQVRIDADDNVFYEIQAFSCPHYWAARWAFPVARYFQRQFVKESLTKMKKIVHEKH